MTQPLIMEGSIGGIPRHKYWTPDGREIRAIPCMRITSRGEVRDANYDRGWLQAPPENPKLYCSYCDMWHDTQTEIVECGKKKSDSEKKYMKWAKNKFRKERVEKNDEVDALRAELAEMKEMMAKLLEDRSA